MDTATRKIQLESDLREVEGFRSHPLMKAILDDNITQQEALITLLCNRSITSMETFFAHFEAIGHLRGLRRLPGILSDKLDEIKTELSELK